MTTNFRKGRFHVPTITDEELERRMARFTPCAAKNGAVHKIKPVDPRQTAYTWSPELLDEVVFTQSRSVPTDHDCAYYGFFKPSIAEVLAQVPNDLPAEYNAFYTLTDHIDIIDDAGQGLTGHRAVTIFGVIA